MWKRGLLWRSLIEQTCHTDVEVLITDDGSTDGTCDFIVEMLRNDPPPFKVRLFRTNAPKERDNQASALPDNVMFLEAGDPKVEDRYIVHLDDDIYIHRGLVKMLRQTIPPAMPVIWFGKIVFVDPTTLAPYPGERGIDPRIPRHRIPNDAITPMQPEWHGEHGCLWVVKLSIIRQIGGHEHENLSWRGGDNRLGARIRQVAKPYFISHPEMTCWHLGIPWARAQVERGNVRAVYQEQRLASHTGAWSPSQIVANGGEAYWKSGALDGLYKEITL